MRRSKLEMYVDVLQVLAQHGPMKLTYIMYETNINCNILKEYVEYLIKQDLVERTIGKKRAAYAITNRGRIVVKGFGELKQALLISGAIKGQM